MIQRIHLNRRIAFVLAAASGTVGAQTLVAPTSPAPQAPSWVVVKDLTPEERVELAKVNQRQR
ncbi:MAG: hypothetical protein KDA28_12190, partial [Phycisphaerales bacterium]|nr:hypothetical protein [Phycisphaerales bacterium]